MSDVPGVEKRLKPRGETPSLETERPVEESETGKEEELAAPLESEAKGEEAVEFPVETPTEEQASHSTSSAQSLEPNAQQKDRLTKEIESVLEEDVTEAFLSMTPKEQKAFKEKGEVTTSKIRVLVQKTKINAKKILDLITQWLKMIPGVNRFFLEQEAKIKTDKILLVAEEEKKRGGDTLA